jgi:hypothetical protein
MRAHAGGGKAGMGEPALTSSRPMGPMSPNGYAMTQTPINQTWPLKEARSLLPAAAGSPNFSIAAVVPAQGGEEASLPPPQRCPRPPVPA